MLRIARFVDGGTTWMGRVAEDGSRVERGVDVSGDGLMSPDAFFTAYDDLSARSTAINDADVAQVSAVQLLAPVPRPPKNVFCVGKNYRAHAAEFENSGFDSSVDTAAAATPGDELPIVFTKAATSISGPGDSIPYYADFGPSLDYEAEFTVLIGRSGKNIHRDDVWAHIAGICLSNDVTARERQSAHRQWLLGKSPDGYLPIGPWLVVGDELADLDAKIECRVNGELRQGSTMSDMIFGITTIIETISRNLTLERGDLIATGTPAGVGIGFTPPRYLVPGDLVAVSAEGFGVLENRVAAPDDLGR